MRVAFYDKSARELRDISNASSQRTLAEAETIDQQLDKEKQASRPPSLKSHGPIYVEWASGDPANPFNWSKSRKWAITLSCVFITALTSVNATSYSSTTGGLMEEFGVSHEVTQLGVTLFLVALASIPMALAPLSETFGRNPIYLITSTLNMLFFLPQALAPNITAILVTRFFHGASSSVGNSMVGGTIADVFDASERGFAMAIFGVFAMGGQALGPMWAGYCQMRLGFRWVFWINLILNGVSLLINIIILRETRGSVLLSRRARKLTKETGIEHLTRADNERGDMRTLLTQSISRPLVYLTTEPIVLAISLFISFMWGCLFLLISSVPGVFQTEYDFNLGQSEEVLVAIMIGPLFGLIANQQQEHVYARASAKRGGAKPDPEVRLYWACIGGLLFPAGCLMYAWTAQRSVHWIVPVIGLVIAVFGIYPAYIGTFNYIADVYERYSSSGQAAQSAARNLLAGAFPLFSKQMYDNLGSKWASTLLGLIGVALSVIPFLLVKFGGKLRAKSKVAQELAQEDAAQ